MLQTNVQDFPDSLTISSLTNSVSKLCVGKLVNSTDVFPVKMKHFQMKVVECYITNVVLHYYY